MVYGTNSPGYERSRVRIVYIGYEQSRVRIVQGTNSLETPGLRPTSILHAKFHLDPSNRLATIHRNDRTDRELTDSIGRTVLQTVAQKN